ncbi:hypothetical protein ACFLVX_02595 [Chloroflexota bacterium]
MWPSAEETLRYVKGNSNDTTPATTHRRSGVGLCDYGSVTNRVLPGVTSQIFLMRPCYSDSGQARASYHGREKMKLDSQGFCSRQKPQHEQQRKLPPPLSSQKQRE